MQEYIDVKKEEHRIRLRSSSLGSKKTLLHNTAERLCLPLGSKRLIPYLLVIPMHHTCEGT